MEIDLQLVPARIEAIRSQVCIVGAGIAGIVLAHRLSERGVDVVLLEAGGKTVDAAVQQAQYEGSPQYGTTQGRLRVFGGTSLQWGGQLLPLGAQPQPAWPIDADELASFSAQAERLLGVDDQPTATAEFFASIGEDEPTLLSTLKGIDAKLSKWTPFRRRNLAATLGQSLLRHPRVRVYLHAQVTELLLASTRTRLEAVLVRLPQGATLRFEASQFVLAAGTVESVRLLLASRSVAPEGVGNASDQVGRNFHDHLTLPAALVEGPAREQILQQMRPWIVRAGGENTTHSAKLEASAELRSHLQLNPVLAHCTFEEPEGSGLAAVRAMLLARQQKGVIRAMLDHAAYLPQAAAEAVRLVWSAQMYGRRFVTAGTSVSLYLNAVQDAPSASRITLSDELDALHNPLARIDWRISAQELHTLRAFAAHLRKQLEGHGVTGLAWRRELFRDDLPLVDLEDARHAMGGACMGDDPRTSVVDAQLAVHGIENLSIASPATFPTGEAHLPTLPLVALTLRLAERLASTN